MEHRSKTASIFTLLFLSVVMLVASSAVSAKVYRWVDENGEVHYSETLPPDFNDIKHDELDSQGIVRAKDQNMTPAPPKPASTDEPKELPRDSSGMQRAKAMYSENELQQRMDNFLLLRYDSEQEILDAMTVEIHQLEYDRILLQTSQQSMADAYRSQIREAAARQRSGVEVDQEIISAIADLQSRMDTYEGSLAELEVRENEINTKFSAQLKRYQSLVHTRLKDS